jgi:methylated-DNA-[protein]-cysteine S-methyltransferase
MINKISIYTKFGWISAFENNNKITKIKFGKVANSIKSKVLKKFKTNLINFLNKKKSKIRSPYQVKGNKNQKKIWNELKRIKIGKTKSYGEIAKKYKLSPRHVGKICGQNKLLLIIPCHRVIRSDGTLGGFSSVGGIKLKRKLLEFEQSWK